MRKNKLKFFIDLAVRLQLDSAFFSCRVLIQNVFLYIKGTRTLERDWQRWCTNDWNERLESTQQNSMKSVFFIEDPLRNPVTFFFAREVIISASLEGLERKKINSVFRKKRMWIVYYLPPNPFSYLFVLFLEPSFAKNCLTSDLTKYLFLPSMNTSRGVASFLTCCRPLRNF